MQALRVFCKVLIINQLPRSFEMNVHLDVNVCCYLRQMAVQSASNGVVTPFTLRGKVNGDKASPPTPLQGEGSDVFSNYILFRLHFHGILLPSLFGEGLGVRLSFFLIP